MSKFKTQNPIQHIPSFKEWVISKSSLQSKLNKLGMKTPMYMLDSQYYLTDMEGWGKLLYDLVFNSSLYKSNRFDCENFAIKAMSECAERYGLNTLGLVVGDIPQGRHGFNIFAFYDNGDVGFLLWEPNEGFPWSGQPFAIGENGYKPDLVLI